MKSLMNNITASNNNMSNLSKSRQKNFQTKKEELKEKIITQTTKGTTNENEGKSINNFYGDKSQRNFMRKDTKNSHRIDLVSISDSNNNPYIVEIDILNKKRAFSTRKISGHNVVIDKNKLKIIIRTKEKLIKDLEKQLIKIQSEVKEIKANSTNKIALNNNKTLQHSTKDYNSKINIITNNISNFSKEKGHNFTRQILNTTINNISSKTNIVSKSGLNLHWCTSAHLNKSYNNKIARFNSCKKQNKNMSNKRKILHKKRKQNSCSPGNFSPKNYVDYLMVKNRRASGNNRYYEQNEKREENDVIDKNVMIKLYSELKGDATFKNIRLLSKNNKKNNTFKKGISYNFSNNLNLFNYLNDGAEIKQSHKIRQDKKLKFIKKITPIDFNFKCNNQKGSYKGLVEDALTEKGKDKKKKINYYSYTNYNISATSLNNYNNSNASLYNNKKHKHHNISERSTNSSITMNNNLKINLNFDLFNLKQRMINLINGYVDIINHKFVDKINNKESNN